MIMGEGQTEKCIRGAKTTILYFLYKLKQCIDIDY